MWAKGRIVMGRRWPQRTVEKLAFPALRRWRGWRGEGPEQGGVPFGIFREKQEIRMGRVNGRIIADGQTLPPLREDSEIIACGLQQAGYAWWPVLWTRRSSARLLGPSLVHTDLFGHGCYEAMYGPQASGDPVWRISGSRPATELAGNWTSLVSRWTRGRNYYHWITDGLTRLLHLPSFPEDTGILVPPGLPAFALESLKLLGLGERIREAPVEHLLLEKYHFAGPSALTGCVNPMGVAWLRKSFGLPAQSPRGHRKIFISRRDTTRDVTNARELERTLTSEGWEIIEPGSLSFREQVATFRQARIIAGIHGAGMTNVLWAPEGTRVVELMPRSFRNGCYAGISLVLGHDHRVLICPSDRRGNMEVPPEAVTQVLAAGE